eukprot:CAMPEP_0181255216 /NCGR_PEP_ID=MMETSP1096-20121128/49027_1 /TAXON_ID=156174 ORGANISM="Chrysochromulina ericina, Strain CCMP281" /NCGR_SAMPLE_ID=MMETSP1096 /ASSEMBLY_ACC=CAM_ASM_000453 /LENGTH=146 /DNA_ID=CAMNT_0023353321 /DNA_START=48 /DNA_END=485 /DNA_ORIENTATION=-
MSEQLVCIDHSPFHRSEGCGARQAAAIHSSHPHTRRTMFRTLWHPAAIRVGVWCADAPRLKIDDSREKLVALHQWVSSEEMGREDVWRHVKRQQMKSQQHEKGREHQKRKGEERQLVGAAFGRLAETLCTGGVPQHPGSRSQALKG